MEFEKILEIVGTGKKLDSKTWKSLTPEQRKQIAEVRGKTGSKKSKRPADGIPWKNDWRFYALSEQIAKDLASIPYNVIPGVGKTIELQISDGTTVNVTTADNVKDMSVMTIEYIATCGIATQRTDGINMAATQLYTFIRRANSGARNYEAADVMMYILAMRELYNQYFEMKRELGIASLYDIENHNLPDTVLRALGYNDSSIRDLRANLAQYRGRLNVLCKKINALAVPSYFKMFERSAFISSKLFTDSTSIRGQFYIFKRSVYYTWSATQSSSGSSLVPARFGIKAMETQFSILESMLDALFLDDDINTMSGDILKAFGNEKCYQVVETPDDFVILPTFDEDVLAQIENAYCYTSATGGATFGNSALTIGQNSQIISFAPEQNFPLNGVSANVMTKYFNSHKDKPEFTDNLEWSRLITTLSLSMEGTNATVEITGCGQELVEVFRIYNANASMSTTPVAQVYTNTVLNNATNARTAAEAIAKIEQFDWHPAIYCVNLTNGSFVVAMDIKKGTIISDTTWKSLHAQAVTASVWADDLYKVAKPAM